MFERIRTAIDMGMRTWKLGKGAVDSWSRAFGVEGKYTPAELGDYLATSNPVFTCATIRGDALAGLKPIAYGYDDKGKRIKIKQGEVIRLLRKVNEFWTMNRLLYMTELSMFIWGKSFWAVERGESGSGIPKEIWWMKSDRVKVLVDELKYISGFSYEPAQGGKPIEFKPNEVVWFRYPNPLDEFDGLPLILAARLAADMGVSAMKSNKNMFDNGFQLGGLITPGKGMEWTPEQAIEMEERMDRRFKGVDKAHRWGVMRTEVEMKIGGVSPKDADWLGGLNLSLEEVARAGKIPLDMVGGQRTYENVRASDRAFWLRAMMPEGDFIASELTEQFLPMFPKNGIEEIGFDYSLVPALQDEADKVWEREMGQLNSGAITINEWRENKGLEAVDWGDEPLTQTYVLMEGGGIAPQNVLTVVRPNVQTVEGKIPSTIEDRRSHNDRKIEFGSEEHERVWRRFARRTERWEKLWTKMAVILFERQRESVLAKLKKGKENIEIASAENHRLAMTRGIEDEPFDLAEWIKRFRTEARKLLEEIIGEAGEEGMDELGITISFDILDPRVKRFLERRAQRFAKEVNETTWSNLKESLNEGIEAGEGIPQLEERVIEVMDDRIESTPETISRTEVIGAYNGGTLEAWVQSEVVEGKQWLAALDDRTRDSHREAHGQEVALMEDFTVGDASGPAPGQMGDPAEDINCRCTMVAVIKESD